MTLSVALFVSRELDSVSRTRLRISTVGHRIAPAHGKGQFWGVILNAVRTPDVPRSTFSTLFAGGGALATSFLFICATDKPYEAEHVTVKTRQWLARTEDRRSWPDKFAGRLACFERGQMSAVNVPYKELGPVVLESGDLVTGTLHDSIPQDVSV